MDDQLTTRHVVPGHDDLDSHLTDIVKTSHVHKIRGQEQEAEVSKQVQYVKICLNFGSK